MKRILVIADFDTEQQLACLKAYQLAKLSGASVHIAIFCYDSLSQLDSIEGTDTAAVKSSILSYQTRWWQQFIHRHLHDVNVTYEVVWEKYVHHWVLEHCERVHYDMVIKTGHRSETFFYTPTDWHLFRESKAPLYTLAKSASITNKLVLASLDFLTKDEKKQCLNEKIMEAAFQMAVQNDAELHIVNALKLPSIVRELELVDISTYAAHLEKDVRERAKNLLEQYDLKPDYLHIKQGVPWQVINTEARKLKAQCIVLGSMGRKGIMGKLIGNTAEKVIHYAETDLLVLNGD